MVHRDLFFQLPSSLFSLPCWAYMPPPGTEPSRKTNEGCREYIAVCHPAAVTGWDNFGRWRREGGETESELCSVCSVGVIHTAIMIDFVQVPTCTLLPFSVSSSQAHRQIHKHYARRTHTLSVSFPTRTALIFFEKKKEEKKHNSSFIDPADLNLVSGCRLSWCQAVNLLWHKRCAPDFPEHQSAIIINIIPSLNQLLLFSC